MIFNLVGSWFMKTILGVIFLSLLMNGCSTVPSKEVQKQLILQNDIKLGMTFDEVNKILGDALFYRFPLGNSSMQYMLGYGHRINNFYGFEQPNVDEQDKVFSNKWKRYKLTKIFSNTLESYDYYLSKTPIAMKDKVELMKNRNMVLDHQAHVAKQEKKEEEENKSEAEKIQIELAEMINKAKSTCKTLGFEEGTDKFTDCSLKLYTQEVENKVALKVAEQKSSNSSNSGTMTIYDPVRDSQNQIDRGMKMLSGGCTLGIDC